MTYEFGPTVATVGLIYSAMSFGLNSSGFSASAHHTHLQSSFVPSSNSHNHPFFKPTTPQMRELRLRRRRRRPSRNRARLVLLRSQLGQFPDDLLQFQFSAVNSLDLIAPVLGFASAAAAGVALYLSSLGNSPHQKKEKKEDSGSVGCGGELGEWVLFTSPTPFNRFVLLRCSSVAFEGRSELLEDRHFVRLDGGRIQARSEEASCHEKDEDKLEYQRVCVRTDDGGVISLDWPTDLDLKEEHGWDTTFLIVPGTAQGSLDRDVRSFVCESLKHGCFPIVMNPRGCAGSPLTTARLFTAADSDDISTAVQFINRERPWTTLMGVGWGYGANMLTKYLAEVGDGTPLTAATCIDNPFDLEEATRLSPCRIDVDQKLTGGLIDILRSNKELFQGREKGYDVKGAMVAKSVRDFEKAISMVSYGFDAIEDFYSKSSTQGLVGKLKIPILFIQNDDGTVPLFSIPRSSIAENPYTSLLLSSCLPSNEVVIGRSVKSWYQHVTIEWLTAVELGLLKGRHPLLKDVDVTINPSKGLALVEGRKSNKGGRLNKPLDVTKSNAISGYSVDSIYGMPAESNNITRANISQLNLQRNLQFEDKKLQKVDNRTKQPISSVETESVQEEVVRPLDSESGQVLQTAQVVMNMLDVTMPGTLKEVEKEKVLNAVGQGETLMKALQDAVPEDVRGKLTTSVSGILRSQNTNLNLDGFLNVGGLPNMSSALKSKIQENVQGLSGAGKKFHPIHQRKLKDDPADGSDSNQPGASKPDQGLQSERLPSEKLENDVDQGQGHSTSSSEVNISSSLRKATEDSASDNENGKFKAKTTQHSDSDKNGSETGAKHGFPHLSEKASSSDAPVTDQYKVELEAKSTQLDMKDENIIQKNAQNSLDSSIDQIAIDKSTNMEEMASPQGYTPDAPLMEVEGNDNPKEEDRSMQTNPDNKTALSDSKHPEFSMSQAFDALVGIDDSTQAAVNSVFGVIEGMITQLEDKENDNGAKDRTEVNDENSGPVSEKCHVTNDHNLEETKDVRSDPSMQASILHDVPTEDRHESYANLQHNIKIRLVDEKITRNPISFNKNVVECFKEDDTASHVGQEENEREEPMVGGKLLVEDFDRCRHVNSIPLYNTTNPFGDSLYKSHFLSKMPNTKPLDLDKTTALFLDYFPEDGQWKLLEQPGNNGDSIDEIATQRAADREIQAPSSTKLNKRENIIEPPYIILDTEEEQEPIQEYKMAVKINKSEDIDYEKSEELLLFVKNVILNSLKVEVGRRVSADYSVEADSDLARDLEQVANTVALAIRCNIDHNYNWCLEGGGHPTPCTSTEAATLNAEHIVRAISFAVHDTRYLRRVLPIGVIVGSSLAALREFFTVAAAKYNSHNEALRLNKAKTSLENINGCVGEAKVDQRPFDKTYGSFRLSNLAGCKEEAKLNKLNDTAMVGAVTAALGASALLAHQQDSYKGKETAYALAKSSRDDGNHRKDIDNLEEARSGKNENNIVTSLAEKAMSVAGPVVPTNEDGEVDQERLVALLAGLGQKGGMLKLVGKIALLWGGIRGAMSLTDKLILFLRIAERPLYYRILGFVCMVLVLWSPVVVPLLPTLVQSWAKHNSATIAELVCIIGLYTAITILVVIWGKRIRGYENPLQQYGLDLTSPPKIQNFLIGLLGGVFLVLSVHSVNALLGFVNLSWASSLPPSLDAMAWLKLYIQMIMWAGQGIVTAIGISLVEELLFRSWLPEEIAPDLGYHRGIIISGLAFSLVQRSPQAIPGLWLLSLALAGARHINQGSLSSPIGLRTGIIASNFVIQTGSFLTYRPNHPLWLTGNHPFQPFSGVVGFVFCLLLATVLYPRQPHEKKIVRTIQE